MEKTRGGGFRIIHVRQTLRVRVEFLMLNFYTPYGRLRTPLKFFPTAAPIRCLARYTAKFSATV